MHDVPSACALFFGVLLSLQDLKDCYPSVRGHAIGVERAADPIYMKTQDVGRHNKPLQQLELSQALQNSLKAVRARKALQLRCGRGPMRRLVPRSGPLGAAFRLNSGWGAAPLRLVFLLRELAHALSACRIR